MKKVLFFLVCSVVSFLVFLSCQREDTVMDNFTAVLENCIDDQSKTTMQGNAMVWESGDKVDIWGSSGRGDYAAVLRGADGVVLNHISGEVGNPPYRAIYPAGASYNGRTLTLPSVQMTSDGSLTDFPMYAESNGTTLEFKNLCGVLRLRMQKSGVSVIAIEVTGDIVLSGSYNTINYNNGDPQLLNPTGFNTTMMTCTTPQSITNQKDFYLYLPPHTYDEMRIRIYSSDGGVCTKTLNSGQHVNVQRSMITTINLSPSSLNFTANAGVLPGRFSIDNLGHHVHFSQGNLQYYYRGSHISSNGSTKGTWRFSPDQFQSDNEILYGWSEHFAWGTGRNPEISWVPYESGNEYPYDQPFVDWGTNAIINGGNQPDQWRTLTSSEWVYILRDRTDASLKMGVANVEGARGLVLLPDIWVQPDGCSFNSGFDPNDGVVVPFSRNTYTREQWALMEAAGAI